LPKNWSFVYSTKYLASTSLPACRLVWWCVTSDVGHILLPRWWMMIVQLHTSVHAVSPLLPLLVYVIDRRAGRGLRTYGKGQPSRHQLVVEEKMSLNGPQRGTAASSSLINLTQNLFFLFYPFKKLLFCISLSLRLSTTQKAACDGWAVSWMCIRRM